MQKKLTKPFITYFEQLNNLIQKKHLNISNLSYAKNKYLNIGYYSLIDGYKDIFYNPMTRTYEKGTNFTDIVALYDFDENLRSLVFKYICHIEQKIRSLISYSFCEVFSENQAAYLNSVLSKPALKYLTLYYIKNLAFLKKVPNIFTANTMYLHY